MVRHGNDFYTTLCPKKVVHQTQGDNFVNSTDFQNYFTDGKTTKFATKPI